MKCRSTVVSHLFLFVSAVATGWFSSADVLLAADDKKPNILVIMGDDIGWFNPSCYNSGIMGYRTPNIDRIAAEGARFTDWYGQQSCTAGRAAFITGQSPIRTGLTKVGLPTLCAGVNVARVERKCEDGRCRAGAGHDRGT